MTTPAGRKGTGDSEWFHAGERAIQKLVGVREEADRVAAGFQSRLGPVGQAFLATARCVALAATDPAGRCWASILLGSPGLLRASAGRVHITALPDSDDPIGPLAPGDPVGLIALDFARRRRYRVNGTVLSWGPSGIGVAVYRAYANCPRHIRPWLVDPDLLAGRTWRSYPELAPHHIRLIASAETLFVASSHPVQGHDASYRGGPAGFLRVLSPHCLALPDYSGNAMFNTLGNLYVHPRVGLVVPDLRTGRTLQITGRATIDLAPPAVDRDLGSERIVHIEVEEVVEASRPRRGKPARNPLS
jgi:predicted pyridoxine 5'-phosphate oxidase superfamily flavin-nucleotide-binding protein